MIKSYVQIQFEENDSITDIIKNLEEIKKTNGEMITKYDETLYFMKIKEK